MAQGLFYLFPVDVWLGFPEYTKQAGSKWLKIQLVRLFIK